MRIKLFKIEVEGRDDTFIAASKTHHAAEIFVGYTVAAGRQAEEFVVSRIDRELPDDRQFGLTDMLEHGVTGIATFSPDFGWTVQPTD